MGKYWDMQPVVTKQRVFNFINGPRSIGKTYTAEKWLLEQAMKKGRHVMYIFRNEFDRKSSGILKPFEKVLIREFPTQEFKAKKDAIYWDGEPIVYGVSLSQVQKMKKVSFPDIYYIMFDEYQLEDGTGTYVNGFGEPELFINLYHTVDREEQRVKCFFFGNNTSYYNPYHLYPLFGIPKDPEVVRKKGIWTNKITLFQMAEISEELQAEKEENPVLQAMSGTRYGDYANLGIYRDDDYRGITRLGNTARYMITVECNGEVFGLYNNWDSCQLVFSDAVNTTCLNKYSLTREGIQRGYPYIKTSHKFLFDLIKRYAKSESIGYTSMEVKSKVFQPLMKMI